MPDDTTALPGWGRRNRRRLLGGGFAVAVVVAVFAFVLPRIADYREVWGVVDSLSWEDWLLLLAATALNLSTFPPPWIAALPRLRFRQAFVMTQASTALSIVSPAGAAVGMAGSYTMLRSWGFPAGAVGLAVAVTGIWNQLASLTFPIAALALLTAVDGDHPGLRAAALVGVVALAVVIGAFALSLSSGSRAHSIGDRAARLANRAKRTVRRQPVTWGGDDLARFRDRALDLLRRRWHVLTAATLSAT